MDNELIRIHQTANTIKVFNCFSFIFNIFNLLISPIYFIDLVIYSIGYYGAKHFSKAKLYIFCIFLIIISILKFISITYMYFTIDLMNMEKDNIINLNFGVSMSLLSFLANIYISRFSYRLYYLINNCSDENLDNLRIHRTIITPLSLW